MTKSEKMEFPFFEDEEITAVNLDQQMVPPTLEPVWDAEDIMAALAAAGREFCRRLHIEADITLDLEAEDRDGTGG